MTGDDDRTIGLYDSEYHQEAMLQVARSLASFRLGLDADDPFAFNDYEKLCAGHIVGRLSAAGLIVDRFKHALIPQEFRARAVHPNQSSTVSTREKP